MSTQRMFELPSHTVAGYEMESNLREAWDVEAILKEEGLYTKTWLVGVGMIQRPTDPNLYWITFTGMTREQFVALPPEEMIRVCDEVSVIKSEYMRPVLGPEEVRREIALRFDRKFGTCGLKIENIGQFAGGASQALDRVINKLFHRSTNGKQMKAPVDIPVWPGTAPKIVWIGGMPVAMISMLDNLERTKAQLAPIIESAGLCGVYLSYPGNGIGQPMSRERLERLEELNKWIIERSIHHGRPIPIIVSDEIYLDQCQEETFSALALRNNSNVVVVYTRTKAGRQAGHRDSWIIVGDNPALLQFLKSECKDALSGNVGWHYPRALAYCIRHADDFNKPDNEFIAQASEMFRRAIAGVGGLEAALDHANQYQWVFTRNIPEGSSTSDFKRYMLLVATALGLEYVDIQPGRNFVHDKMLEGTSILLTEMDGLRVTTAYGPEEMWRIGHLLGRYWFAWVVLCKFVKLASYAEIAKLLKDEKDTEGQIIRAKIHPLQILIEAGLDVDRIAAYIGQPIPEMPKPSTEHYTNGEDNGVEAAATI